MNAARRLIASLATAAAALAPAAPAAAQVIDIVWNPAGAFERDLNIPPGAFAELCGKLPAGVQVRWDFEASAPLDFNVHCHAGKDVVFPTKLAAVASAKDTLDVKIAQDHCWMWTSNSAVPTSLGVRLQRQ